MTSRAASSCSDQISSDQSCTDEVTLTKVVYTYKPRNFRGIARANDEKIRQFQQALLSSLWRQGNV